MSTLPTELYQVDQIRELERIASQEFNISAQELMANAGQAALEQVQMLWPEEKNLCILVGGGNNAGDGYVLAGLAQQLGYAVSIYYLEEPASLKGTAQWAFEQAQAAGVSIQAFADTLECSADIIVDAILGIGVNKPVAGSYLQAIEWINNQNVHVLALDIPTGVDANTGRVLGDAVVADVTLTFLGLKAGLLTGEAIDYVGELLYADLDLPADIFLLVAPYALRLAYEEYQDHFSPRPLNSHKGDFGHVVIIGGDYGMAGAVCMAANAALRVGAGLVSVVTRKEHVAALVAYHPEVMCYADETVDLKTLLQRASVIVIGPGLGRGEWGRTLYSQAIAANKPLVIDADGLYFLKRHPHTVPMIITPHPGEAAELLETSSQEIQANRFAAIAKLQATFPSAVCILKGAGTLVRGPEHFAVCDAGNPGMATAGMGDILTGVISGVFGQFQDLLLAAELGVLLHAVAGDIVAMTEGERGILATDLLPILRRLVNQDMQHDEQ